MPASLINSRLAVLWSMGSVDPQCDLSIIIGIKTSLQNRTLNQTLLSVGTVADGEIKTHQSQSQSQA